MILYNFKSWHDRNEMVLTEVSPFEPSVEKVFDALHCGMSVVDIGSAMGYYTIKAGEKVGEEGKVLAIEPHPDTFHILLQNVELHKLKNVILVNKALGKEKKRTLIYESYIMGGTSINPRPGYKSIPVEMDTLDNLIENFSFEKVDLIKIDVQGWERDILLGASYTLRKHKPQLIVEVHSNVPHVLPRIPKMPKGVTSPSSLGICFQTIRKCLRTSKGSLLVRVQLQRIKHILAKYGYEIKFLTPFLGPSNALHVFFTYRGKRGCGK